MKTKLEDKRKIAQHEQEGGGRKRKRRKLDLLADWGEHTGYEVSGASGEDDQGLDMIPQHVPQLVPQKVNVITTRVARKQLNIMGFTMSGRELLERMVNSWVEVDLLDILWNRLECREWGREIVDNVLEVDVMNMVMGKQVVEEILGDGLVASDFDREMIVPESTKAGQGVQKKEVGADKSEPEPKKKKKATKKELLAMASLGCKKITSWCRSVGQDDVNTHVLVDQQMSVAGAMDASVKELIMPVIEGLLDRAWVRFKYRMAWSWLEGDSNLQKTISKRLRKDEEGRQLRFKEQKKRSLLERQEAKKQEWLTARILQDEKGGH